MTLYSLSILIVYNISNQVCYTSALSTEKVISSFSMTIIVLELKLKKGLSNTTQKCYDQGKLNEHGWSLLITSMPLNVGLNMSICDLIEIDM